MIPAQVSAFPSGPDTEIRRPSAPRTDALLPSDSGKACVCAGKTQARPFLRTGINANPLALLSEGQSKPVFRVPFLIAIALTIAFGGGIWSTLVALDATIGFGAIKLGSWEAFPQAQTAQADPYAKSHRANAGKLLYASAEGLTFLAAIDEAGDRLTGNCSYRLTGHTPPARFWTLFAAAPGAAPPLAQSDLPTALNSRIVLRKGDDDGGFDIAISATPRPGNWLAVSTPGAFRLTLTLFDTPTAGSSGLIDLTMPRIQKIGCGNG